MKAGAIPVDAGTLFKFVHEVCAGDVIIYPSKHDRLVNIGRATGKRHRATGGPAWHADLPNHLSVDWLGHFPRSDFSQAALNEIGSFISLFRVRQHAAEFVGKISIPDSTPSQMIDEESLVTDDVAAQTTSQLAEENTEDFVVRRLHTGLTGYEFEHFTAHLLQCMGYFARVSEKSGDGGVDVIAHTDQLGFKPPIIKVQCKRQTSQIGEPEVSQLLGTLGDGEYALFVTLGSYTRQARVRERNNPRLRLLDGEDFVQLVLQHYTALSARYRTMFPLKQIYVPDLLGD
ncbi:MAG: restriction endonuclease [Sphingomonas sp.]